MKLVMYNTVLILNTLASMAQYSRSRTIWKTSDSTDQNQVADQRFSLKQWFAGGAQSRGLRKPGCDII